jgi:uncharacterized protein YggE
MNTIMSNPVLQAKNLNFAATAKRTEATATQEIKFQGATKQIPQISAVGSSVVYKDPDTMTLRFSIQKNEKVGVKTNQKQAREAVNTYLNQKSEELVRKIEALNIPELELVTNFNGPNQQFEWVNGTNEQKLSGYSGSFTATATVRKGTPAEMAQHAAQIKTIVEDAEAAFGGVNYDITDKKAAKLEALEQAVQDAKEQAEVAAHGLNVQLGKKPLHVQIGGGMNVSYMAADNMTEAASARAFAAPSGGGAPSASSFKQGKVAVSAPSVQVIFQIE